MDRTVQIGNLAFSMDHNDLLKLFAAYGSVCSAKVSTHCETGASTGVAFVEMASHEEAEAAIAALNGQIYGGRVLSLSLSQFSLDPDTGHDKMFGPMNMTQEAKKPDDHPERRGLP